MSDLISREDVLALLPSTDTVGPKPSALRERVLNLPGVVRCRDCLWHGVYAATGKDFCVRPLGEKTCIFVQPDGFCSNGERRKENERE